MVEPCGKFDELYINDLTSTVKNVITNMEELYLMLDELNKECDKAIKDRALCKKPINEMDSEVYENTLNTIILPWIHELYKIKLIIQNNIKIIIYFIEMKFQPFNTKSHEDELLGSVIYTFNSFSSELTEINEYNHVSELKSGVHTINQTLASSIPDLESKDCKDIIKIRKNIFLERAYIISNRTYRLKYMLHVIQKALYAVRKLDSNYKTRSDISPEINRMFL